MPSGRTWLDLLTVVSVRTERTRAARVARAAQIRPRRRNFLGGGFTAPPYYRRDSSLLMLEQNPDFLGTCFRPQVHCQARLRVHTCSLTPSRVPFKMVYPMDHGQARPRELESLIFLRLVDLVKHPALRVYASISVHACCGHSGIDVCYDQVQVVHVRQRCGRNTLRSLCQRAIGSAAFFVAGWCH